MQEHSQKEMSNILIDAILQEKRTNRRWKNIRFIFWFALIAYIVFNVFSAASDKHVSSGLLSEKKYAALVRIDGMIAPDRDTSAEELLPSLKKAFSDTDAEGVIIEINSPGGTPVQAAIIHDAIITYKEKYKKKVIVVGEDLLTSGAYYIAIAADSIYVNENTLTGSIGVIMKGFGFVDVIKKLGIERRVYTAGKNKDRLDPFLPQSPEDLQKIDEVMNQVHKNFSNAVLADRKNKLKADISILFTGDFWSGQQALELGLVDGLGNLLDVSEKEFQTTRLKEYGGSPAFMRYIGAHLSSAFDKLVYLT